MVVVAPTSNRRADARRGHISGFSPRFARRSRGDLGVAWRDSFGAAARRDDGLALRDLDCALLRELGQSLALELDGALPLERGQLLGPELGQVLYLALDGPVGRWRPRDEFREIGAHALLGVQPSRRLPRLARTALARQRRLHHRAMLGAWRSGHHVTNVRTAHAPSTIVSSPYTRV